MKYVLLILFLVVTSCTKELKYSKEEMFFKAKAADESTTFILPKTMSEGVHCTDYTEGCLSAHMVQVKKLDFIAVEFMTEEQAKAAAKKFRGFYTRNWFFDDISGEPILEEFVQRSLEAKKP